MNGKINEVVRPSIRESPRRTRVVVAALLFALCGLSASACGTWVFPSEVRVEPEVVNELRNVGQVLKEVEWKDTWGDVDFFGEVLVVDGRDPSSAAAVEDVVKRLGELDWKVANRPFGQWVMTTEKWKDVEVTVASVDAFIYDDVENTQVALAITQVTRRGGSGSPVILAARPLDE
jgi:hypothetical protein